MYTASLAPNLTAPATTATTRQQSPFNGPESTVDDVLRNTTDRYVLSRAPRSVIDEALRRLTRLPSTVENGRRFTALLEHLVYAHGETRDLAFYEDALVQNCHTAGSADNLTMVIKSMRAANLIPSPRLYHNALRVCS